MRWVVGRQAECVISFGFDGKPCGAWMLKLAELGRLTIKQIGVMSRLEANGRHGWQREVERVKGIEPSS